MAIPVPFRSRLTESLQPGQTLFVQGNVLEGANSFEVNLLNGAPEITDNGRVVLHIKIRFDQGKIVLNSLDNGSWGKEERVSNPFAVGQAFDLRLRAHTDKFELFANQKEIHEFKFRQPLESINFLNIGGDITLRSVHWGGRYFNLPFETGFPTGSLHAGNRILLYGRPTGKAFSLNLIGRDGSVLFHLNPRFNEKAIVRNAQIAGSWGAEEREGSFPLQKDIAFDLFIVNEPYSIQIFINGQRYATFQHRTSSPDTDYVGIRVEGDIELTGLEFNQH